ncbi:hypothetical protein [Absidia glauca]|uniref:Uncharacterized protein n=1 Tax=Absidia glauca TaxID=4829 RepID=A0A168RZS8_ABSGL|nr:hypothetical protein [Absidia glauca]
MKNLVCPSGSQVGLDTHFQQLASAPTFSSWPRCPNKTNEYGLSIRGLPTNQHPLPTVGLDAPARRTNTGSVYAACRPTNTHFRQLAPIDSSRRKLATTLVGVEMAA